MINLHKSYEAGLGLEFTTPVFGARTAAKRAEEANNFVSQNCFNFLFSGEPTLFVSKIQVKIKVHSHKLFLFFPPTTFMYQK